MVESNDGDASTFEGIGPMLYTTIDDHSLSRNIEVSPTIAPTRDVECSSGEVPQEDNERRTEVVRVPVRFRHGVNIYLEGSPPNAQWSKHRGDDGVDDCDQAL